MSKKDIVIDKKIDKSLDRNISTKFEIAKRYRRKIRINKTFLGIFLLLAIATWLSKLMIGILHDFGYSEDGFNIDWWRGENINELTDAQNPNHVYWSSVFERRPNFLWMFTQFTWITTTMMIMYLSIKFFQTGENAPRWLRWITSQRSLSLIATFEIVVCIMFWSSIFQSFTVRFNKGIYWWEFMTTVLVHAVLPILLFIYSVLFAMNDSNASLLRESFVLRGMLFPTIYGFYYILVSYVWNDPYAFTNFKDDWVRSLIMIPAAMLIIYILIGLVLVLHNWTLLRFNKKYIPEKDYDTLLLLDKEKDKIKRKAFERVERDKKVLVQFAELNSEIYKIRKYKEKIKREKAEMKIEQIQQELLSETDVINTPEQHLDVEIKPEKPIKEKSKKVKSKKVKSKKVKSKK